MAGTIKHRFVSPVPDEGVAEEVGPDEWGDSFVVAGGNDGAAMVRRTSAPDGWETIYLGAPLVYSSTTQAANSGTGETDLHSFTLAAAHFNANKRSIRLKAFGSCANTANQKILKLKFGAAGSLTLFDETTAAQDVRFDVEVLINRTGSNAQEIFARVILDDRVELFRATTTETDSGALVVKLTGQSDAASSDILLDWTEIQFLN